jgi:hypothetical protein
MQPIVGFDVNPSGKTLFVCRLLLEVLGKTR